MSFADEIFLKGELKKSAVHPLKTFSLSSEFPPKLYLLFQKWAADSADVMYSVNKLTEQL